ncbi:hypothetical protein Q3G72_034569 [Acer saccharum]|nr:hypothetical protein Q3G72_034569 [Acer saccharum]
MPPKSKSSFKDLVKNWRSVSDSSVFRLKKATNVGGRAFTWRISSSLSLSSSSPIRHRCQLLRFVVAVPSPIRRCHTIKECTEQALLGENGKAEELLFGSWMHAFPPSRKTGNWGKRRESVANGAGRTGLTDRPFWSPPDRSKKSGDLRSEGREEYGKNGKDEPVLANSSKRKEIAYLAGQGLNERNQELNGKEVIEGIKEMSGKLTISDCQELTNSEEVSFKSTREKAGLNLASNNINTSNIGNIVVLGQDRVELGQAERIGASVQMNQNGIDLIGHEGVDKVSGLAGVGVLNGNQFDVGLHSEDLRRGGPCASGHVNRVVEVDNKISFNAKLSQIDLADSSLIGKWKRRARNQHHLTGQIEGVSQLGEKKKSSDNGVPTEISKR